MRFIEPTIPKGDPDEDKRIFIDPETARLRDVCHRDARIIHIPRKRDTQRLQGIAELGRQVSTEERSEVRILDIGGGSGLYDKLLADQFIETGTVAKVISTDVDRSLLGQAKQAYGETPGLEFSDVDVEKEGEEPFPESFDLVMASWPENRTLMGGVDYRYTKFIHKNRPPFVVWVGDCAVGDFTGEFDVKDEYQPVAEFWSRFVKEVTTGMTNHGRSPDPGRGDNLFTVYARTDLPADAIERLKQVLQQELQGDGYPWEAELNQRYPKESDDLTFDVVPREPFSWDDE